MARRKCKICGVREWSKNSVGQLVCKEGHLLEVCVKFLFLPSAPDVDVLSQNYRNETLEKDELGPHAMKKRAIKTVRERTKVNHDRRCE
jgi:RNA polymerase I-specific transcription initiation factor RRN7